MIFNEGGYRTAEQLWEQGYETRMIPAKLMMKNMFHVAHATAAVGTGNNLRHKHKQKQTISRVKKLFGEAWIKDLENDDSLDK